MKWIIRFFAKKSSSKWFQKKSLIRRSSEDFSLGNPQSYLIWQERNGWLDSSPKNLRQMNPEKALKRRFLMKWMIRFFAKKSSSKWFQKKSLIRRSSEDFSLGNPQSDLVWQEGNGWLDSSPKIFVKWIQKKNLEEGFQWNEWLDSSPKNLRPMIPEEISDKKIFRRFLFRKSSIRFGLIGRKWMIRFFVKKSSSKWIQKNS